MSESGDWIAEEGKPGEWRVLRFRRDAIGPFNRASVIQYAGGTVPFIYSRDEAFKEAARRNRTRRELMSEDNS